MSTYDKASLVLIPSGTKESLVFSQKPTNGDGDFTFSRSTSATRVGPSGYIEKETQNLLLQSNQFDTTWSTNVTTLTSGQSGYDGSNDAWSLFEIALSNIHDIFQSASVTGVNTFSVYVKGVGRDIGLRPTGIGSGHAYANFDLTNGVVGNNGGTDLIDATISSVGGGWYRCSLTLSYGSAYGVSVYLCQDATTDNELPAYLGDVTKGAYIQDAQLEQGLVARDYIETTTSAVYGGITDNIPRLDYTDSSCPSLLLEPQRSNLMPYSEYFGLFNTLKGASITSNYSVSPEGVTNGTRVLLDAQSESRIETSINTGTTIANNNQTISCWVKSNGADTDFRLKCTHSSVLDYYSPNLTATSEWQRFTFTQLFGAGSSTTITPGILNSTANNAADLSIYGMQLEVNSSYATSYIPTYGTSVTRNADAASKTGISSLIGQTEGTLYWEGVINGFALTNCGLFGVQKTSTPSKIDFGLTNDILYAQCFDGTNSLFFSAITFDFNTTIKLAFAYKAGNYALYKNGALVASGTNSTAIPVCDRVAFHDLWGAASSGFEKTSQALVFKTRLSNEELEALTTL